MSQQTGKNPGAGTRNIRLPDTAGKQVSATQSNQLLHLKVQSLLPNSNQLLHLKVQSLLPNSNQLLHLKVQSLLPQPPQPPQPVILIKFL